MPTFDPSVVPTIAPSNLLTRFIEDENINIRWFTAQDPLFYTVLNRVPGDLALRQLILAKAIGQLNLRAGHQLLYPFLIQPKISTGSADAEIPTSMFWDVNVKLDSKFINPRLSTITRLSGSNTITTSGNEYTGSLRFTFIAQDSDSSSTGDEEIFYADMEIDSNLLFQIVSVIPSTGTGADNDTSGFIIFRTPDQTDAAIITFLDAVAPPIAGPTDSGGNYLTPTVYNVTDNQAGGPTEANDYSLSVILHGTGLLLPSAISLVSAEEDPLYFAEKGQPLGTATLDGAGNVPPAQLGNVNGLEIDPLYFAEKGQPLGAATLDSSGNVPLSELGNVHSNANDPTTGEKQALAGTVGAPSTSNRYVTDFDPRNTNARLPLAHKDTHKSGGTDAFTSSDLLEAAVKRIRESGGPTDLTVAAVLDNTLLKRSGSTIVGVPQSGTTLEGILSGEIIEQSPLALGVRTVGLIAVINGVETAVSDQNISLSVAHPTNPRIDIIQWNGSTIAAKTGSPAVIPFCPIPDPGNIVLCAIHVTPATTQIAGMNGQTATSQGTIIAYYYVRGGLYASRIGVTDSPSTTSTSFQDAAEMFLSVYFPRAGAAYELGWDTEAQNGASLTPGGISANLQFDEADEDEDRVGRRTFTAFSSIQDQAAFVEVKTTKGSVSAGQHRLRGRFREYSGSGITVQLRKFRRRIWIKEMH